MLGRTYDDQVCSVARALEIVGERWTLLIVRDALLGKRRFDEFRESLGLARNVLSDRLGKLVDHGILQRVEYQERPVRQEYHLTARGRELRTVVLALMQWGDRNVPGPLGPPRVARHAECGAAVTELPVCAEHGVVTVEEVEIVPGPGFITSGRS
jgi:DNA-binding HxlR family transcriptional regulator